MRAPTALGSLAVVSPEYPPNVAGGLGTHVYALTRALAAMRTGVHVFTPDQGAYPNPSRSIYPSHDPRIHIHTVSMSRGLSPDEYCSRFASGVMASAELVTDRVEVVHCHDWVTTLAGLALKGALSAPLVLTVHLPQTDSPLLPLENLGLLCADAVVVHSEAVAQEVASRGLVTRRPLEVIQNGVDLSLFRPPTAPSSREQVVLFVGRLVPQKGVDVLLHAFRVLLARVSGARLLIAGDGPDVLYLQRLSRYLGVSQETSFLGWQTGQSLVHLYQLARVVAIPSRYEPFGLVALEALSCATPVVASKTGGLAEVIQDGVHGYLVPSDDHLQLAQRLALLLTSPSHADSLGRAGRLRAANFSWARTARQTQSLYRALPRREIFSTPIASPVARQQLDDTVESISASVRPLVRSLVDKIYGDGSSGPFTASLSDWGR